MREIKFRARRIDTGTWVHGHYFKTPLTDENSGTTPDVGGFFLSDGQTRHCIEKNHVVYVVDEMTLGEATGIKDTDADEPTEIFEGDIITNGGGTRFLVRHSHGACGFVCIRQPQGFDIGNPHELLNRRIIGNIYENPELLTAR